MAKLITDKKYAVLVMASNKKSFEIILKTEKTAIILDDVTGNEIVLKKNKNGFIFDENGNRYYFSDTNEEFTDYNY